MSKTIIEIVGKDNTGSAISSVQDKLSGLSGSALKVTASLSAIGATGAIVGLAAMTKHVIDSQDELKKLSERTGLAIESLSGIKFAAEQSGAEIEKVGKAARQFSTLIADANAGNKSAIDSLNNLGIAYQKLKDSTPEDQLLALADALQKYSKEDRAIALTSILGDRMSELVPLLQGGAAGFKELIEEGKRLNPVTAESAAASERFNDNLDRLAKGASTLGISIANQILPALAGFTDRVVDAQREGNVLIGIWRGLKEVFAGSAGLDDIGKKRKEVLDINRQLQSELKPGAFGDVFKDDNKIEFLKVQLRESTKELQALIDKQTNLDRALKASDEGTKKFTASTSNSADAAKSAGRSIKGLSDEQRRLAEEQRKTQALFSEGQRLTEDLDPWIKRNNQIKRYVDLLQAGAIEQEIFNKAVAGANTDYEKAAGILADSTEEAVKSVRSLGESSQKTFDEMSQFAIQAARNIQTSFANFFFDPFDNGLKGLVAGFGNAIRRFIAEAAALKTIQGLGLGNLVGVGAGGSGASAGLSALNAASIAGALKDGFSTANTTLTSALGGGFQSLGTMFGSKAVTSFGAGLAGQISRFSNIGGAGTAFIGGPGTALGGSGLSGGAAASLGSSFAAASAPLLIAAISTSILKGFAGNKQIGGGFGKALNTVGNIPILGDLLPVIPLLNGLFGRGPLKQKETNLVGNFTAEDFQGVTSTKFKAQGGLLVGDKTERVKIDTDTGKVIDDFTSKLDKFASEMSKASKEIGLFLDNSIKGISTQFRGIAKDLGLSTTAIDNFSASINIATEKGKGFTDEQLAEEIGRVADKMALELMPSLEGLGKAGESASQTLARIGSEFTVLVDAATNLGHSLAQSNALIKGVSIEARTAFVDAAGGMDALASKTAFFAENFLTAGEQLAPVMELVANKLKELGLSGIKTKDQFKEVVQSFGKVNGITKETLIALLDLAPAFAKVTDSIQLVTEAAIDSSSRQLQLARQAASRDRDLIKPKKRLTDEEVAAKNQAGVDKEVQGVEAAFKIIEAQAEIRFKKINEAITQADSFINDQIRAAEAGFSFINSLKESVADISTTSRAASKAQLDAAIQLVRITGDIKKVDTPELRNAIELLKEERTDLFSNRKDFSKDQADTARKINELAALGQFKTDETIKTLQDQLSTLKAILGSQELQTRVSLELARSQALGVGANVGASKEESIVANEVSGFSKSLLKARIAILGAFGGSNGASFNSADSLLISEFKGSALGKDNIIKKALSALLEGGPNLDKTLLKLRDKFDSIGGNNPFVRDDFFKFPEADRRTGGLNALPQFNFQTLVDELKLLREETKANKTASQQMAALLNSVTRGGSAMVTV